MNFVTLEHVGKQYSERVLLEDVNLLINDGDRIGLIGPNGSGKTTLLRLIAGLEGVDEGQITVWGNVRIQFLPQDPELDPALTVLETLFQSDALLMRVLRDYQAAAERLQQDPTSAANQAAFAEATAVMDQHNGWAAEAEAKTILTQLGITQFAAKIGTLSGGRKPAMAIASVRRRLNGFTRASLWRSEVTGEGAPVGGALLQEGVAAFDGFVGHVGQARRLAGEQLLADQAVVEQVECEFQHPLCLR